MARAGYTLTTTTDVALVAATAKTVLAVRGGATFGVDLQEAAVSFDGVVAGNAPVLVELCRVTFATNPPGTNSTDVAADVVQDYGLIIAHGCTAGRNWTVEPTVVTSIRRVRIHPQAGVIYQIPLGRTPDCIGSSGFGIRCTAAQVVNVAATLGWERL